MRKDGPNGPDQHEKVVAQRRQEALKRFDAGVDLVHGIELEASVTQRRGREQPKVRRFAHRALAHEC